jgi:hypothetical protein
MKKLVTASLLSSLATFASIAAGNAAMAQSDTCQLYGYAPHTRDYAVCRANLRYYWNTGPCADARFVATHRWHCHAFGIL